MTEKKDVDSDTDKENADPAVVDVEDSFAVDPAERAEAKRFLKEQERLQERHRNKLLASANVNRSASMLTSGTLDLDAVNASHSARNTTMQLSVGDDVPSRNSWETLSAAAEDNVPADEADRDQEEVQQFAERDLSGRFSVSTFDSGSTRSSFYRDSPSPTRTPVRQDLASAAKLTTPPKRLRFDNDSSDGEPEDPSPASAVSYKTAEEPSSSYETVASTTEFLQRGGPRSRLRIVDYTSSTGAGSCWMESNDYVLVNDSRKRRSTSAGSLVLLGSISQKMRKMGVRQEPSIGSSEPHAVDGSAHQKEGREAGASISVPSLFIVIPGEHDGYTFTKTRLGSGNFGTVSVAVREYAVKKVNGKDPEAVRQCTEGVSLLRRVSHEMAPFK
ncbi:hypothetical protein AAVH_16164 [Aphelenchoides avenae]|nr:hypothetical protein AAVH_16164 [Aphelenchus avenae]